MKQLVCAAVVLATAALSLAQDLVPPTPEAGKKVYTSYCARCHGIGLAVGSSAYFDLRTFPMDDKARFLHSVTNGKRQMPAWGEIVRPDQIEAIWAYIGSVNGVPEPALATGRAASGANLSEPVAGSAPR